jgi:hypothetical protein
MRIIDHTKRRTTVGRTPLDKRSARRRDLYLTTHNTHSRRTSMIPVGFKPTISAGERPQTYATGAGISLVWAPQILYYSKKSSKSCCGDILVTCNILNKARKMEWERDVERRGMLTGNARRTEELDTEVDERGTLKWM